MVKRYGRPTVDMVADYIIYRDGSYALAQNKEGEIEFKDVNVNNVLSLIAGAMSSGFVYIKDFAFSSVDIANLSSGILYYFEEDNAYYGNLKVLDDKKLIFGTDSDFSIRYNSTNDRLVIRDEVNAREILIGRNGDLLISGNVSITGWTSFVNTLVKSSVSPTLGTDGAFGPTVDVVTPDANHIGIVPMTVKITVGGTLATDESITVRIIAIYSDSTTAYVDKTYTTTGDNYLTTEDLHTLIPDGLYIVKLQAAAASSATTTSATVTVEASAIQH